MLDELKVYNDELRLIEPMSLADLIASHRHLRSLNMENAATWRNEVNVAIIRAEEAAGKRALELGWFSADRLRGMPVLELANLLTDR